VANARIVMTLAGVFLAGVGTGMLAMRYGLHEQVHRAAAGLTATDSSDAVLQHYRSELNLTEEQTQKLASVIADYRDYYRTVDEQVRDLRLRDQIEDLRATGKNRILEILNDDQKLKFEKMTAPQAGSAE
jgi:uncharacterized membrane-anchored protein YhcB (DUF1043 family)